MDFGAARGGKTPFEIYKTELRPLIARGNLYHVTERPDGVRWDGIEYASPELDKGVLFAFRGTTDVDDIFLNSKGLLRKSDMNLHLKMAAENRSH